jgi:polysaccharide biosynthesis/export protein
VIEKLRIDHNPLRSPVSSQEILSGKIEPSPGVRILKSLKYASKMILVVVIGVTVLSARGQEAPNRPTPAPTDLPARSPQVISELTKDNLEHVAASSAQIKAVLLQEPGLLVELKRWIARQASDNGQLISDEELTDAAVYDRLANDVKFRAVATRLVQRYGYLRPSVNPDSDMGKEQEFILKERARKLVQVESQEDQVGSQVQRADRRGQTSVPCRAGNYDENNLDEADCRDLATITPRKEDMEAPATAPRNEREPATPEQPIPSNPNPSAPIMRAQAGTGESLASRLAENPAEYQPVSSLSNSARGKGLGDSLLGSDLSNAQLEIAALDLNRMSASLGQQSKTTLSPSDIYSPGIGLSTNTQSTASTRSSGHGRGLAIDPTAIVHRSNPYADIPSLYDLYVQAPSRNGTPQRFGAQVFQDGLRDLRSVPMDLPVGPDYVVGPGDSLSIDMWGGASMRLVRSVDRQGRVTLPEAGPLQVSGRSLGEVQQLVQKALASEYRDTSAEVSVARLRTIRVYVVGEVSEPGAYDISSLSTPLNALVSAGGVTARGSLRRLKHYHGRQLVQEVDAYDLLLRGVTPEARKLENGDTLLVPPVSAQVTVTGMVRRPSIYELHEEKTLAAVLELAGGILPAATLKHVEVQRLVAHEKRTMLSLDLSDDEGGQLGLTSFTVRDGDEIHIFPIAPYNQEAIYLQGHVLRPGKYSFHPGMRLTEIITSYHDLLPEPAAHYGEIIRLNPPDFRPSVVSFDLESTLKNPESAPALEPLDTVRVFSRFDFEPAPTVSVSGEVRVPGTYKTSGQASLRDAVFLAGGLTPNASLQDAQLFRINADGTSKIFSVHLGEALHGKPEDNILLQPRDRLLIHRNTSSVDESSVEITGEVAKPGRYPYTDNMRAQDLIRVAGGLKRSADSEFADLTRYAAAGGPQEHLQLSLTSLLNGNATEDVPLRRGDVLAIRQVPGWADIGASVKVSGEVMNPSTYGVRPGERLSSVLERAGGFTKNAYPYGAVLMRRDIREIELKSQMNLVARIKTEKVQLKSLPESDTDQRNAKLMAISQTDATLAQLTAHEPVGRVVIHIEADVRRWKNTNADIPVHDGDVLLIPKNPNTIMVTGQVFNPTAISHQSSHSANWYLSQAGGLTPLADKKSIFVIRGDGSVISAKSGGGWWVGDALAGTLRPGDTVVVPEKVPKIGGANTWTMVMQAAQVATAITLAVAYLHP